MFLADIVTVIFSELRNFLRRFVVDNRPLFADRNAEVVDTTVSANTKAAFHVALNIDLRVDFFLGADIGNALHHGSICHHRVVLHLLSIFSKI